MALASAQVIDAVAARLVPVALSGGRVYTSRLWPLTADLLPAWKVVAGDEPIEVESLDGRSQQHTLSIEAAGFVHATQDVDFHMHALAAQGLTALFAFPPPYGLELQSIDRDPMSEGAADMGAIRLRMTATFFTDPSAPETIL